MEQLVGIFLIVNISELPFEFWIDKRLIRFSNRPLFLWGELLHGRETPWLSRVVLGDILVSTQLHLEVQLRLVGLANVISDGNEVLELGAVSRIIEINATWSKSALSRLSSFKNLAEKGLIRIIWVNAGRSFFTLRRTISFEDIGILGQTAHFVSLLESPLEMVSFLDVFCELLLPLFHVIVVKRWWIWHCLKGLSRSFFFFIFIVRVSFTIFNGGEWISFL